MQKSKLRWLKILELILLIIRMMIIALIALAFARPALTGKQASSHAPASVVLLIDDSPSLERLSSGGMVFDDLKRGALKIIDMLKSTDDVSIISLAGETSVKGTYSDLSRAREVIGALQPQAASANFKAGLEKAAAILAGSHNLNREIYILSDFQSGAWWDQSFDDVIHDTYRYFAIKFTDDDGENVGLTKIELPPQLLAPGEEFEIQAEIQNHDDKTVSNRLLGLYIDGEKRAQTIIDIKPHGRIEQNFKITIDSPGRHNGYFELEEDGYSPDNRFYFNFELPGQIKVLGVAENPANARLLYNALARTETGYIQFSGVNMSGFSQKDLSEYDVIILNDVSALSLGSFNNLADFVNAGKGLFIILGSGANPDSYKNFLEANAGIKLNPPVTGSSSQTPESFFSLDNFDLTHPILKIYSPRDADTATIPRIKVYRYYPIDGGLPIALIGTSSNVLSLADNKRIMVMSFGMDKTDSDISLHSFIVPFLIRSVEFLASSQAVEEEYFISGNFISLNLADEISSSSVRLVRLPGVGLFADHNALNESEIIEINRGAYGAFINISHAGYPGFYCLINNEDTVKVFSVNHDSRESSGKTLSRDELQQTISPDIVVIDQQNNLEETVMQAKFGFELWKYCLLLALILLMAESILVRKAR